MKTISATLTTTVEAMCPEHANAIGSVHGGTMLKLMDNTSGIAAMRHAGREVVTACVQDVQFVRPIKTGDLIECNALVVYTGSSSMVVRAEIDICDVSDGSRLLAMLGFFVMVARGSDGTVFKVPPIFHENEYEKALYEQGENRYNMSRQNRLRV